MFSSATPDFALGRELVLGEPFQSVLLPALLPFRGLPPHVILRHLLLSF